MAFDDEDVRLLIYSTLAGTGAAPSTEWLAEAFGVTDSDVCDVLQRLAAARHIVIDDDMCILMAHPFSAVPLGFSVMGEQTLWWGGCAWDAFALPNLLRDQGAVLVATTCPGCGSALAWTVGADAPPAGDEVAHFLVPVSEMWHDVVHTCGNQRLFCTERCVDDWLAASHYERGYVMDLATLWRLATHWYDGRLDRGYVRREPQQAADYFGSVGLSGPFWGR
ncbi:MAG: hypothetical protein QOG49_854 [Frankiaceae bacterium]|nr:hypothetical protein [Frankiaceae bacterium]